MVKISLSSYNVALKKQFLVKWKRAAAKLMLPYQQAQLASGIQILNLLDKHMPLAPRSTIDARRYLGRQSFRKQFKSPLRRFGSEEPLKRPTAKVVHYCDQATLLGDENCRKVGIVKSDSAPLAGATTGSGNSAAPLLANQRHDGRTKATIGSRHQVAAPSRARTPPTPHSAPINDTTERIR